VGPGERIGKAVLLRKAYIRLQFVVALKADGVAVARGIAKGCYSIGLFIGASGGNKKQAQKIAAGKKSRMVSVLKTNVLVALVSG
jgi:hypothetical protein